MITYGEVLAVNGILIISSGSHPTCGNIYCTDSKRYTVETPLNHRCVTPNQSFLHVSITVNDKKVK